MNIQVSDLAKLKKELSLLGTTFYEKCQLAAVSCGLVLSVFGLPFLDVAWKGMRMHQNAAKLQDFAIKFQISSEDAEKLVNGYSSFIDTEDLLSSDKITGDDCKKVESLVKFLQLRATTELTEKLSQYYEALNALYYEAYSRIGRYAWYRGTVEPCTDPGLREWFVDITKKRDVLIGAINQLVRCIRET